MTNLEAYHEGIRAFNSGVKRHKNPYDEEFETALWKDWNEGWGYAESVKAGMEHDAELRKGRAGL